jgi:crossover junction endodeoxyribonuclease RusA
MINDVLKMPWPPSANRYWRHVGHRVIISREARCYKAMIKILSLGWKRPKLRGRLSLNIQAFPPDKRQRDIDNICKVTLDALQDAGLFINDSQIDKIYIERMPVMKDGELRVVIEEIKEGTNNECSAIS